MIESELFEHLKTNVPAVENRIYALRAKQIKEQPYIVFHKIASTRLYSHDGDSKLTRELIQISCYHRVYERAKEVVAAVRAAMELWEFKNQEVTERDVDDPSVDVTHCAVDYYVWHKL